MALMNASDGTRLCAREGRRSLHVLVADDSAVNRKLYSTLLEQRGHEVITVDDGAAAVDRVQNSTFDLVLMDVEMPGLDGLEATKLIRRGELGSPAHLPIVALTAHTTGHQEFLRCGMDSVLVKPLVPALLDSLLEQFVAAAPAGSIELFDREAALDRLDGQQELLREIVSLFMDDCPGMVAQIRQAMARQDHESVAFLAHKFAGALGSLSAEPARLAARELEVAANANSPRLENYLATLETSIRDLMVALRGSDLMR